jgi:hypothetical protein
LTVVFEELLALLEFAFVIENRVFAFFVVYFLLIA